jgi:hypothetical protein
MRNAHRMILAAALISAPLSLDAQRPAGDAQHGRGPGVAAILQHRAQLDLTADQVARLEAIERDLRARNEPLRQQMSAAFPERAARAGAEGPRMTDEQRRTMREQRARRGDHGARAGAARRPQLSDEQRQQMRGRMEQLRPVMEQMRGNTRQAMEQARAVLTDAQREQLRARMGEHRSRGGAERGWRGRPGAERAPRTR